jgi:hypothetical protein
VTERSLQLLGTASELRRLDIYAEKLSMLLLQTQPDIVWEGLIDLELGVKDRAQYAFILKHCPYLVILKVATYSGLPTDWVPEDDCLESILLLDRLNELYIGAAYNGALYDMLAMTNAPSLHRLDLFANRDNMPFKFSNKKVDQFFRRSGGAITALLIHDCYNVQLESRELSNALRHWPHLQELTLWGPSFTDTLLQNLIVDRERGDPLVPELRKITSRALFGDIRRLFSYESLLSMVRSRSSHARNVKKNRFGQPMIVQQLELLDLRSNPLDKATVRHLDRLKSSGLELRLAQPAEL